MGVGQTELVIMMHMGNAKVQWRSENDPLGRYMCKQVQRNDQRTPYKLLRHRALAMRQSQTTIEFEEQRRYRDIVSPAYPAPQDLADVGSFDPISPFPVDDTSFKQGSGEQDTHEQHGIEDVTQRYRPPA